VISQPLVCNDLYLRSTEYASNFISLNGDISVNNLLTLYGINPTNKRLFLSSDSIGTRRTIRANDVSVISNVDFRDISIGGSIWDLSDVSGGSGDCGGNSGIIFTPDISMYFRHTSGAANWNDVSKWVTSSGGETYIGRTPLPQDRIYFDQNSFTGACDLTASILRFGSLDMSTVNQPISLIYNVDNDNIDRICYGNYILGDNVSQTGNIKTKLHGINGDYVIQTPNSSFNGITIGIVGSKYTALSNINNISTTYPFYISGVFDANDFNILSNTMLEIIDSSTYMGNGTWEMGSTGYYGVWIFAAAADNIYAENSLLKFNKDVTTNFTYWINFSSNTFNNVEFSGTLESIYDFSNNTEHVKFNNFTANPGKVILFRDNYSTTIHNNFSALGNVDSSITLRSRVPGTQFILNISTNNVNADYLYIQDSSAFPINTWYAGSNSVDLGNNSGWLFSDIPTLEYFNLIPMAFNNRIINMFVRKKIIQKNSSPSFLSTDGNTVAWYKYDELSTLVLSDSSVSEWKDYLGSGRDIQAPVLGSAHPTLTSTGILFDGVNDMLSANFELKQPEFIYLVLNQITFDSYQKIFDGGYYANFGDTMSLQQSPEFPNLVAGGGADVNIINSSIGEYFIFRGLYNSTNSKFIINDNTPVYGNIGTRDASGFTLARDANWNIDYGNIEFKEIIIRNVVDSSENEYAIYNYLKTKYNL
jgi:hypothetical protein